LTGSLSTGRSLHTATLLPDGHVLVAGGGGDAGGLNSVELYDPASGTWAVTNSLAAQRFYHRALLLPNGHVMIVGGLTTGAFFLATAESYDPASGTWTPASGLNIARYFFTATILPDGRLLAAGGEGNSGVLNSTEIYDPASGFWTNTGSMTIYRVGPTATLLANGKVLVTGANNSDSSTAELYDPATGTWTATGSMTTNRANHGSMSSLYTATLLANGKVLVAGGNDGSHALASAELYNQASSTWTLTGALNAVREGHTATLLPNGKVLVAGGDNDSGPLSSAEVYDPASGTWTLTGSLNTARDTHTATLLPNGKVLVAGGANNVSDVSDALVNAELYDPASGTWTNTGSLNTGRGWHTATLLPNGKVLVAGGRGHYARNPTLVEAFDPTSGTWTTNGSILYARYMHTATLLPDGKVLIAGGTSVGWITSAEVYDPVAGYTTANTSLNTARFGHAAAFLLNGKVLVTGGNTSNGLPTAELFDSGLGFNAAWQPQIATCTSPLTNGGKLTLTGTRFRGMSEGASGQTQDSPADYPVAQLRRLDNEQTLFLLPTNWQTNSFTSTPLTGLPNGYAMVTLFVNGIPSPAATLDLNPVATPIPFILTHPTDPTGKVFQCRFTNTPGLTFTVLGATNLSLPLSNWPVLGGVTEISPGLYQVTESTTNYGKQFYRVRSQ
jgi:N-acetylneuraminic acid mutarotase